MQTILKRAGVSPQWWNQLSRGLKIEPNPELLDKLAAALQVSRASLDRSLAETKRRGAR